MARGIRQVSIPQSEFDGLGPTNTLKAQEAASSVSIPQSEFDGLGPDPYLGTRYAALVVSIPQSEFDGLGLGEVPPFRTSFFYLVSIPQSEFDGLGPSTAVGHRSATRPFQFPSRNSMDWDGTAGPGDGCRGLSFNSPVGIRWIGTPCAWGLQAGSSGFNSPVGIRWIGTVPLTAIATFQREVSIPQSEFDGLGPAMGYFH